MKEKDREYIWEAVHLVASLVCEKCQVVETINDVADDYDATDEFINKGWKVKKGLIVCPKCTKRIIK